MHSHPFDLFAQLLARGISRRDLLRTLGGLAAGASVYVNFPRSQGATAYSATLQGAQEPEPPAFPFDPTGLGQKLSDYIDDYVDCIAAEAAKKAGTIPPLPIDPVEECDKAFSVLPSTSWCDIRESMLSHAFPNLTGVLLLDTIMNSFGEDCGTVDCLQCCYVPSANSCHSSFIGEGVINCSENIYGKGTRGVGLTLLLAEPVPGGTCLFTPQTCDHVALCLPPPKTTASSGGQTLAPAAAPPNYLTDPRAIKQRARIFASYALVQARHYIDEYATDTPDALPLQSLNEAVLGRGWATWRQDIAGLNIDLNDPLFRATDSQGNLMPSASLAKVGREFATMRLLTGLPNLAARLQFVESKVWSAADKASYLAATPDPDAALAEAIDPHIVGILKRMPNLQDYKLLAVPLPGEPLATGLYGGMALGQPPTLLLSATLAGLTVTLTATLTDPTDGVGGLARPLVLDWGDGRTTRTEFTAGQATLTLTHEYATASRYAIYGVAANNSGLRGAACVVAEVALGRGRTRTNADDAASAPLTSVRAGLTNLSVSNLPFVNELRLALYFSSTSGERFRAGRSRIASGPTNITVPVALGDAYAHNPSRLEIAKLSIEPRHAIMAGGGGRITSLTLATLLLGVFSTAQMRTVDTTVVLRAEMLAVFLEGSTTPLPAAVITNADGSLTVPLLYRAASTAPWQRVERIEIATTPAMLGGFVLDASPTAFPAGTSAAWVERRPGSFTRVVDAPSPAQTPTAPTPTSTPTGAPERHKVFLPIVEE